MQAAFADLDDDIDDVELSQMVPLADKTMKKTKSKEESKPEKHKTVFAQDADNDSGYDMEHSDDDSDEDDAYDFTALKANKKKKPVKKRSEVDGIEIVPKVSLDSSLKLDSEGLSIGAAIVQSRKRKREIVDSAYHR